MSNKHKNRINEIHDAMMAIPKENDTTGIVLIGVGRAVANIILHVSNKSEFSSNEVMNDLFELIKSNIEAAKE